MNVFEGRRALVTGAASGMGRLLAIRLATMGADMILVDVDADGMEGTAQAIRSIPGSAHPYVCDLTDPQAIRAMAEAVLSRHGAIDLLVNNAGVVSGKNLLELSDRDIVRTFEVNTLALFRVTRAFLPTMIEQRQGHIVTIASAGGLIGSARLTDYASSKFAAVGFDESLRFEMRRLGHPIRTTVVCPYYVATEMFKGARSRVSLLLPILKPEDVVDRIVTAIRKKRRRVIMPRFAYAVYPLRLLPVPVFDAMARLFGIPQGMDHFVGKRMLESLPTAEANSPPEPVAEQSGAEGDGHHAPG